MDKKLSDKIKDLNSTRVFKKVTPMHTKDWYVKWFSSVVVVIGMILTSAEMFPLNLYFHLVGVIGWTIVGFLWHDRALILLNGIAIFIFATGIVSTFN